MHDSTVLQDRNIPDEYVPWAPWMGYADPYGVCGLQIRNHWPMELSNTVFLSLLKIALMRVLIKMYAWKMLIFCEFLLLLPGAQIQWGVYLSRFPQSLSPLILCLRYSGILPSPAEGYC